MLNPGTDAAGLVRAAREDIGMSRGELAGAMPL